MNMVKNQRFPYTTGKFFTDRTTVSFSRRFCSKEFVSSLVKAIVITYFFYL